jgi:hypothetical protein
MAGSHTDVHRKRRAAKKPSSAAKGSTYARYPQWKVDLFSLGLSELQQSHAGQTSGRARRTPGA